MDESVKVFFGILWAVFVAASLVLAVLVRLNRRNRRKEQTLRDSVPRYNGREMYEE